jgi:hypothetical protein
VRLQHDAANALRTRYAVLLTEHEYSRQGRYQVLLPILGADRVPPAAHDLRVPPKQWMRVFNDPPPGVVFPVDLLQSVWEPADITADTHEVVDESTMREIEAEICSRFDLPGEV